MLGACVSLRGLASRCGLHAVQGQGFRTSASELEMESQVQGVCGRRQQHGRERYLHSRRGRAVCSMLRYAKQAIRKERSTPEEGINEVLGLFGVVN